MIEMSSRNPRVKDRRKIFTFIAVDRRKGIADRRGEAIRKDKRKRRKEFERHLRAQR